MENPKQRITYAVISEKFPIPKTRFDSYELANRWAKMEQPQNRPFYIVKCIENYEIIKGGE